MGHRPRVFYGWWVVATGSLGLCFSAGTIVVLSFGVFFKPLGQYFHAGRAAVSLAFTLHNLVGAACVPLIGRLIDRFGGRRVILTGTPVFASILLSSALLGTGIVYLYLFFTALGLVFGSTSPVPYGVVVSRWFDQHRGLALGLMMLGLGVGAITLPLIAHQLIAMFDWGTAYAAFGSAALLSLPVLAAFLQNDPKDKGLLPDGALPTKTSDQGEKRLEGLSWHDTWHQPTFWLLISAFFLVGASVARVRHPYACALDRSRR